MPNFKITLKIDLFIINPKFDHVLTQRSLLEKEYEEYYYLCANIERHDQKLSIKKIQCLVKIIVYFG